MAFDTVYVQFKRNPTPGILFVVTSGLFLAAAVLQIIMENPIGAFTIIPGILFLVLGIWNLKTPLAQIQKDQIVLRQTPAKKRYFELSNVTQANLGDKHIELTTKLGTKLTVPLAGFRNGDKQLFYQRIEEAIGYLQKESEEIDTRRTFLDFE